MGSKSGGGGGGGGNKGYQGPKGPVAPPSVQDKKTNQKRSQRIIENTVQSITRKQTADPTRMQGGADSTAVWKTVSMQQGNFVKDSRGNPVRGRDGKIVMTSKGRQQYEQAMSRIPLTRAQVESQRKFMNVASLPLMFVPGGGLLRSAVVGNFDTAYQRGGNTVMTYGKGNLLSQDEQNTIATNMQQQEMNKPVAPVDLSTRPRKAPSRMNLLDKTFAKFFGGGNLLGTGGGKL